MKAIIYVLFLSILFSCNTAQQKEENTKKADKQSLYGDTLDAMLAIKDEQELKEVFGAANVSFDTIWGAEGEFTMGTLVFAGTADRLEIIWSDPKQRKGIASISSSPFYNVDNDQLVLSKRWLTRMGIRPGTRLTELETINGAAFSFFGFGWDYGGNVSDWGKGKLATEQIHIQLGVSDFLNSENPEYNALMGDGEFLSSLKEAQKLNPVVLTIIVSKAE